MVDALASDRSDQPFGEAVPRDRPAAHGPARMLQGLTSSPQRPDCVAGHVRLELRNVGAKYPFESSHRFPRIQPISGHRDYSRLGCGGGDTQLGSIRQKNRCFVAIFALGGTAFARPTSVRLRTAVEDPKRSGPSTVRKGSAIPPPGEAGSPPHLHRNIHWSEAYGPNRRIPRRPQAEKATLSKPVNMAALFEKENRTWRR